MNSPHQSPQDNEICQVWLKAENEGYIICIYTCGQFYKLNRGKKGELVPKESIRGWEHLQFA